MSAPIHPKEIQGDDNMKFRKFLPILMMIAVLLAACASQPAANAPAAQPPANQPAQADAAPAQESAPVAIPTSRGDQLQATDPATVSLASGGLQLVEFFRFT
jgi:hypothetical protein